MKVFDKGFKNVLSIPIPSLETTSHMLYGILQPLIVKTIFVCMLSQISCCFPDSILVAKVVGVMQCSAGRVS